MGKFLYTARYSSASWARLVNGSEDRATAVRSLLESVGGSLDLIYWDAHENVAYAIAELPDVVSAKAAATAVFETGAFTGVEGRELLTQDQLSDALTLTRSAGRFYFAPGKAAVEADAIADYQPTILP
jgi:uncharacterized protein with GYD domain